ncbi:MAG: hypothetical protein RLZZ387_2004 [Chloroflexota bacterium]|jgi:anti-anti-sigma regulatory factor
MSSTNNHNGAHPSHDAQIDLEAQLVLRDAMLQAVSFTAQRFLSSEPLEESIPRVLERLGVAAAVSRVYIFERHPGPRGQMVVSQRYEWCAPGIAPQIGNTALQDLRLSEAGMARWEELLGQGKPVYGRLSELPMSERAVLEAQQVISIAMVPIFIGEHWWGMLGFDACVAERRWSAGEIEALKAAASILGAAIERRRVDEELRLRAVQDEVILAQQAALQELSTPLLAISDSAVVMPIVGAIDSTRAQQIIETLLEGVSGQRASVAIIDITGVAVVDTQVANALLRAAQAVKLLGAKVVLTGIRPEIAQTLVGLGVDLGGLITRSTLQAGIALAMSQR